MALNIVHPCIGRHRGYLRTWEMESVSAAVIAGLTPKDVEVRFYDHRMETIPFDEPRPRSLTSFEMTNRLFCCHFERSEKSFPG